MNISMAGVNHEQRKERRCCTIKSEEERTHCFTHCFVHSLNLDVRVATKSIKVMKYARETIRKISKLTKRSQS